MGRPTGSKNRPKAAPPKEAEDIPFAGPYLTKVEVAEKIAKAKTVLLKEPKPEKELHRVTGYINIQANPNGGFYTGGDIHETIERAKQMASRQTVTQLYVAFEVMV